jgi:hypothetical protein
MMFRRKMDPECPWTIVGSAAVWRSSRGAEDTAATPVGEARGSH